MHGMAGRPSEVSADDQLGRIVDQNDEIIELLKGLQPKQPPEQPEGTAKISEPRRRANGR